MPFKKIFKPIAKVLDKVIPNEIKPALPYLAAFAPVFGPTAGMFGNTMMKRALLSGGANILGQLSQEGSEGDINLLSAGLGALTGAMTVPGTGAGAVNPVDEFGVAGKVYQPGSAEIFRSKAAEIGTDTLRGKGLEALAKGSDIFAAGAADPFSKAGLKAATLPAATATGDVMQAEARRLEKQAAIDDALAQAELLEDSGARAAAIRNAMNAYGFFTDEEIEETISSAGYKAGGRVGLESGGGLGALARGMQGDAADMSNILSIGEGDGIKIFIKDFENQPEITGKGMQGDGEGGMEEIFVLDDGSRITVMDYIEKYGMPKNFKKGGRVGYRFGGIDEAIDKIETEKITELVKSDKGGLDSTKDKMAGMGNVMKLFERDFGGFDRAAFEDMLIQYSDSGAKAKGVKLMDFALDFLGISSMKNGGRVNLREGGGLLQALTETVQTPAAQNAPMFLGRPAFAPTLQQPIFPRLNQLEQGVNMAENKLSNIRGRLGNEQRQLSGLLGIQPFGIQPAFSPFNMGRLPGSALQVANRGEIEPQGMKEGGLMDLDGKEMDLRGGGFVPIGKKEKADDVPARLSKNEFVMTADAVRAAGGGSVNKGAKRMYNLMNTLEARA